MSKPIRRIPGDTTGYSNEQKKVEQELRGKVKDLEAEVKSLKCKLDELRKAKNTTLIKREKEFVTTSIPQRELKQSPDTNQKLEQKVEQLRTELSKAKLESSPQHHAECFHEEVILALQTKLVEVESMNTAVLMENEQLHGKLNDAYEKASQMEAEHCNQMEKTKEELQSRWQTMYKEWMRTTEQKIVELQTANDIMRQTLEGHRPQQ